MKISFLSLTATLAATVPYLTSAALLDFFVPESSAEASTESLPDYSKVLKKISKKRKVQTLKLSIPSPSSKNEEEEEGGDIVDRDLGSYIPTMCEYETMISTFSGDFQTKSQELVDWVLNKNGTDNCHSGFDISMCVVNGTGYHGFLNEYCNYTTRWTMESYALEHTCVDDNNFFTVTWVGLPICLSNSCDDVTDFFNNLNISHWERFGFGENDMSEDASEDPEEVEDDCVSTTIDIFEWFNDTVLEDAFYCGEDEANREFVYKMKDGEEVMKTCGWLDQFPMDLKHIACTDHSSYPSAYAACPKACCTCKERPEDRFFVKMKENNKGKLKAKTTECSRIDDIDDPFFKYQLCHRESQKPKLVGNGNTICPQSCGTCPSPEMFMGNNETNVTFKFPIVSPSPPAPTPPGSILCPGQANFCDCGGDCVDDPEWCACEAAVLCCN